MLIRLARKLPLFAVLLAASSAFGSASPAISPLLALVPAGVESVAGVEDPHNPKGHVLLIAGFNNFDLDAWLALAGVDDRCAVDELIWAVASSSRGELREHMLLIAGRFDRERIFAAAQSNGAATLGYDGFPVLLVAPFAREQGRMPDDRWMAILHNRMAIFGTPDLVRKVLDRYAAGEPADPALLVRLSRLGPGLNSWNTMAMPSAVLARHLISGAQADSLANLIAGAEELTVGVHYGSTARVDFAIRFTDDGDVVRAAGRFSHPGTLRLNGQTKWRPRVKSLSVDSRLIAGSVSMPGRQFDAYLRAQRDGPWTNSLPQTASQAPLSNSPARSAGNSFR